MTFEELRSRCGAVAWIIRATREGSRERIELNLYYTANAREKLARYDGAEVVSFRPVVTEWPHGPVNTLEVELDV